MANNGILLSFLAGSATAMGGASVWFISRLKPWPFVSMMSFAAGVMIYISFSELLPETISCLETVMIPSNAKILTPVLFFFGWCIASAIDHATDIFTHGPSSEPSLHQDKSQSVVHTPPCVEVTAIHYPRESLNPSREQLVASPPSFGGSIITWWSQRKMYSATDIADMKLAEERFNRDCSRLFQIGLTTAIAIGAHNLPEGVMTYSGAAASSKLGLGVATAIGFHNIPEGFAVAVPIYIATGNRWKSFLIAALSGMAEPVGAILCRLCLGQSPPKWVLGIIFGIVCGIMASVAFRDLFFESAKYDPINVVATKFLVAGMIFMAMSLILIDFFNYDSES